MNEIRIDTYNFFRYYEFYQLGIQLELYASPDDDIINTWNKNIEKIDNLAFKYNIYDDYIDIEDKYGVNCFDDYILPKTYEFFKFMKELLHKEENNTCDNCKYCHLLFYFRKGHVIVPLSIPANRFCTKIESIIDKNNIICCNYYEQK